MNNSVCQEYFYPYGFNGFFTSDNFILCFAIPALLGLLVGNSFSDYSLLIAISTICLIIFLSVSRIRRKPLRYLAVTADELIYTPTELGFPRADVVIPFSSIKKIDLRYGDMSRETKIKVRFYLHVVTPSRTFNWHQEFFHNPADFHKLKAYLATKCKMTVAE